MKTSRQVYGLLIVGAGPRLVGAAAIVALLWAGFFWVTGTPGAL
ncbi:MAG: hypothetical protein AAF618_10985 [Pseudomonadota bacterium]